MLSINYQVAALFRIYKVMGLFFRFFCKINTDPRESAVYIFLLRDLITSLFLSKAQASFLFKTKIFLPATLYLDPQLPPHSMMKQNSLTNRKITKILLCRTLTVAYGKSVLSPPSHNTHTHIYTCGFN